MTADIATLGLRVDSSQVTAGATALDKLTAAAAPAAAGTSAVSRAAAAAAAPLAANAAASNTAAASHKGMSTQAMAAGHSIRSMAEMLAMGVPPTTILASQMNHLSYAATGPGGIKGAFSEAIGALRGFITPAALVGGGLVAIAAAAYFTYSSIKKTELAFGELSERTATTVRELHGLESAAAFKGIETADFIKGMERFGDLTDQAKDKLGSLYLLFRANGVQAGDLNDTLFRAADLVRNARNEAERYRLVQQLGLPATREWVRYLSQGSEGLRQAVNEATQFGGKADENLIRKAREFDEAWNKGWKNFVTSAKSAFVEAQQGLSNLSNNAGNWVSGLVLRMFPGNPMLNAKTAIANGIGGRLDQSGADAFYKATGAGTSQKTTVDPNVLKQQLSLEQQRIGILGQMASVGQQVRAVEISIQQARLSGVNITKSEADNIKRLTAERALGIDAMKAGADSARVEADTIAMSAGQAAAYTAVQNRLNQAKRNGETLTAASIASIRSEADAMGQAVQRTDEIRFEYETFSGTMRDLTQQVRQNGLSWQTLGNVASNALGKITDRLTDMASRSLWQAAFPTGGGFLSSLFGSTGTTAAERSAVDALVPARGLHSGGVVGSERSFTRYVHPAYFDDAPRFHAGIGPGETAAVIRNDESVLTPGQMKALGNRGNQPINVTVAPVYNFYNSDPGVEARLRQQIAQTAQKTQNDTVAAVARLHRDSPGNYLAGR